MKAHLMSEAALNRTVWVARTANSEGHPIIGIRKSDWRKVFIDAAALEFYINNPNGRYSWTA